MSSGSRCEISGTACRSCQTSSVTTAQNRPRGKPTLEEVAARAGVSRATASRVLRGAPNVSDEARAAVLEATEAISYTPNLAARSLVTGRADSVAFVVDETEERMFSDPFFLTMLRGAHAEVAEAGLQLVFSVVSERDGHRRFLEYAAGNHVDGVMLVSLHGRDDLPHQLEELGVPTILSGRPLAEHSRLYHVDADNLGGGRMATEHLLRTGRRRVATVTGPLDMCAGQDRLAGYREALARAGQPSREELVAEGAFTAASGYAAMERLLSEQPAIDAVFAGSDLMALGVMRAIERSGRRVYDDIAVVGFDDVAESRDAQPPLTTVRQPIEALGRTMSRALVERIGGGEPPRETILPVQLIRRATA